MITHPHFKKNTHTIYWVYWTSPWSAHRLRPTWATHPPGEVVRVAQVFRPPHHLSLHPASWKGTTLLGEFLVNIYIYKYICMCIYIYILWYRYIYIYIHGKMATCQRCWVFFCSNMLICSLLRLHFMAHLRTISWITGRFKISASRCFSWITKASRLCEFSSHFSTPMLVGGWTLSLWKIWKTVGMMIIPNRWENKSHLPNHQPAMALKWHLWIPFPIHKLHIPAYTCMLHHMNHTSVVSKWFHSGFIVVSFPPQPSHAFSLTWSQKSWVSGSWWPFVRIAIQQLLGRREGR